MTDHASHGDASPECTRTSLVAWGAGISRHPDAPACCAAATARPADVPEEAPADWRTWQVPEACDEAAGGASWAMDSPLRTDVHQAQLAPLMAAVLGAAAPTNGRFVLPAELLARHTPGSARDAFRAQARGSRSCCAQGRDSSRQGLLQGCTDRLPKAVCLTHWYSLLQSDVLSGSQTPSQPLVQALWANVRSLLTAYDALETRVAKSTFGFVPDPGLAGNREWLSLEVDSQLASGRHEEALAAAQELAAHAEASLLYLQRYHWKVLYSAVLASYVAWMVALVAVLLSTEGGSKTGPAGRASLVGAGPVQVVLAIGAVAAAVLMQLTIPVRPLSRA
jgi:Phosphatidylinositolglycan class N (PIG-N)